MLDEFEFDVHFLKQIIGVGDNFPHNQGSNKVVSAQYPHCADNLPNTCPIVQEETATRESNRRQIRLFLSQALVYLMGQGLWVQSDIY